MNTPNINAIQYSLIYLHNFSLYFSQQFLNSYKRGLYYYMEYIICDKFIGIMDGIRILSWPINSLVISLQMTSTTKLIETMQLKKALIRSKLAIYGCNWIIGLIDTCHFCLCYSWPFGISWSTSQIGPKKLTIDKATSASP